MDILNEQPWMQLRFGKPVEKENGPIIKGSEHKTTAASSDIDQSLYTYLTPASVGIGSNDRTDWREYTWLDEGGGMVTEVHHDQSLIVAGKVCGRTETGKKLGRMYTESHYAILPLNKYQYPTTLGLFKSLQTTPHIAGDDFTLPSLSIPNISLALPDNWLALVTPVLKIILSGSPFSIKTTKRS